MLPRKFLMLFLLLALVVVAGEIWVFIQLARAFDGEYLGLAILAALMSYAGVRLSMYHSRRLAIDLMSGRIGNRMVGLAGAVLLAVPGFAHGIVGLLLQIPVLQRAFAKPASTLAMSMLRNAMGGGFSGGMPGGVNPFEMMGGFMQKGSGPVKTIDTTAERVDEKKP